MAKIAATFEVNASHTDNHDLDVTGLSIDEIVEMLYERSPGISLCWECATEADGAELGELAGFSLDGVDYVQRAGRWVRSDER